MPFTRVDEMADLALKRVAASGAEYGDIRFLKSTTQTISGEDRRIASIRDMEDSGFGVRVLYHGAWGFAASSVLSLEEVPRVADLAVEIAKGSASLASEKTRLVEEPVHRDRVATQSRIDPFTVPLDRKNDAPARGDGLCAASNRRSFAAAQASGHAATANCSCRPKGQGWNLICAPCRASSLRLPGTMAASRPAPSRPHICVRAMS